ncbi:hypothetical protein [Nitrospina watsonii]|uniref:hypothetical protein n=1 Tax=Nitrospina watsonii TaxID=1323948 RepID=UPI0024910221|nr:hypothetical protein [Nitrospina watsonii]
MKSIIMEQHSAVPLHQRKRGAAFSQGRDQGFVGLQLLLDGNTHCGAKKTGPEEFHEADFAACPDLIVLAIAIESHGQIFRTVDSREGGPIARVYGVYVRRRVFGVIPEKIFKFRLQGFAGDVHVMSNDLAGGAGEELRNGNNILSYFFDYLKVLFRNHDAVEISTGNSLAADE